MVRRYTHKQVPIIWHVPWGGLVKGLSVSRNKLARSGGRGGGHHQRERARRNEISPGGEFQKNGKRRTMVSEEAKVIVLNLQDST